MRAVLDEHPTARLLVAGPGDASVLLRDADPRVVRSTEVLGVVTEEDKASLLASFDA